MAKKLQHLYTFYPSLNKVVIEGNIHRRRLLLITNVTTNQILYNFGDPLLNATSVTYDSTNEETTIILTYNTAAMSSTDTLQIFVEEDSVEIRPTATYTDPVSKFRVSEAQTLIDTDFEYGLQSTKWETLELVNNIPGFYSSSGDTPITLTSITANSGSNIITVNSTSHGLLVGTPFDVRGLSLSNLDGSYIVQSVAGDDTFTFVARSNSTISGTISGAYTYLVPGKFYSGSDISFRTLKTDGASPSAITVQTTTPHGFTSGTEFYVIDSLGSQALSFDSSTSIEFNDTNTTVQTFDPNAYTSSNGTGIFNTDIWDYTSTLNTKYCRGNTDIAANTININNHGFSNNNVVFYFAGPGATAPTGLTSQKRYYIVNATTNSFQLSLTSGGAAVTITAATGSGIQAFYRGYTATNMANATTDVYTWNEDTSGTANTVTLFVASTASGTNVGQAAVPVTSQDPAKLYNDSTAFTAYYFTSSGTTTRPISLTPGGTAVNFTATFTPAENVFIPIQLNTLRNTFFLTSHGFSNDEAWVYNNGGGTSISNLTSSTTYYIDYVDANRFGLKPSTIGSRIDITGYSATGIAHSFARTLDNPTKDTFIIPSHGFTNNLEVTYTSNGGTSVGGLTNGQVYYTRDVTTDRFRLSLTQGSSAINLTSAGVGIHTFTTNIAGAFDGVYSIASSGIGTTTFNLTNSSITVSPVVKTFDPQTKLYTGPNFIEIAAHRFATGSEVIYTNGGGTNIGGLTNGSTYYVIRIAKDGFRLATTYDNAIAGIAITFTSTGTGTQHVLTSYNLNGENTGVGTITVTPSSKIITGTGTKFNQTFKSGDRITVGISSTTVFQGTVYGVLSDTKLQLLTAPTTTEIGASTIYGTYFLKPTSLYVKSNAYGVHRPFDGGVEINAGLNADAQIVRQTRRYFRYQSGKGLASQFAINFNPPLDISTISAAGTVATVITRYPHGLSTSQTVTVREGTVSNGPNPYNGTFQIKSVIDTNTFDYYMTSSPAQQIVGGFPQLIVRNWGGSRLRAGMFDFQNGMFYEYDGSSLYAVRRDSTSQLGGSVAVNYGSNLVSGTGTRFIEQLEVNDRVVIRGQSYKVINIPNQTTMYVQPTYRGASATNVIVSKTIDTKTQQNNFSIDPCDGTGSTGYVLDVTRIQMAYMDYSWYGAGKIRYGFKDQHGEVIYVHEYKHNNKKNEAFMRSGNLPARYEAVNIGSPIFAPSLAHWGTTVQMDGRFDDDGAYLFTASSPFLTFSGTTATTTGIANTFYNYVNADGSTTSGITTFTTKTANSSAVNITNERININNHGYQTGQLIQYNTAGTVIGGLTNNAFYYAIRFDTNNFRLATTAANASTNTAIDLTSQGTGTHNFRSGFTFSVTPTSIPGFGSRYLHRFLTDTSGFAQIGNVSFGTEITSTAISARGSAYVYRVIAAGSGSAFIDFFFKDAATDPNGSTNFIPSSTSAAILHTVGTTTPVPSIIPLISLRLSPSVDGGITGLTGQRDIINRMQLALDSLGVLTTHDVEIRLILNGQNDNIDWTAQGSPSLTQVIAHKSFDNCTGGYSVFTFRATGNSPDSSGRRTANSFTADISSLLSLGNATLGGDGVYPNGPDVLTIAAIPLNTTGITVNSPMSISSRLSWSESQA